MLLERVTAQAALVEADNLGTLIDGLTRQRANAAEVVRLVSIPVLELRGGDADVAHDGLGTSVERRQQQSAVRPFETTDVTFPVRVRHRGSPCDRSHHRVR